MSMRWTAAARRWLKRVVSTSALDDLSSPSPRASKVTPVKAGMRREKRPTRADI